MDKLFILIPIHNRIKLTLECLESLKKQTYSTYTIIVVDDGSSDKSSEIIEKNFPNVIIVQGNGQLFWGGAVHKGIEYIFKEFNPQNNEYVLLLNNDTKAEETYFQNLVTAANQKPDAVLGSVSVDYHTNIIIDGGVKINWKNAKYTRFGKTEQYEDYLKEQSRFTKVNVLSGRGMLIPIHVLDNIGNVNSEKLPHYGADYELSVRALKHGYDLFVDNQSKLLVYTEETGLNTHYRKLSLIEFIKSFISKRSYNSLKHRWIFAKLCAPPKLLFRFYFFDVVRTFLGGIYNQIMLRIDES